MSQADIEALKEGFDASNSEDFERLLELWEEDVELVGLIVSGEPLRGKEAPVCAGEEPPSVSSPVENWATSAG